MKNNDGLNVAMLSGYIYADSQQYAILEVIENDDDTLDFRVKKTEEESGFQPDKITYDFDPVDKTMTFECYNYNYYDY